MNDVTACKPERLRLGALISGSLLTVALMVLLMSTSGEWRGHSSAFGATLEETPGLWMSVTTLAWLASVALGASVAALAARATSWFDGLLHGLTVWAAGYLIIGGLILTMMRPLPELGGDGAMARLIWSGFAGDVLSLFVAMFAGVAAALGHRHSIERKMKQKETP